MHDTSSPVVLTAQTVWAFSKCMNFILTSIMILKLFLHQIFDGSKEPLGHLLFYCQLIPQIYRREGKESVPWMRLNSQLWSGTHDFISDTHIQTTPSHVCENSYGSRRISGSYLRTTFFPSDLLRNNCHITLFKFKVYNMSNWYTYILQNDYHCS